MKFILIVKQIQILRTLYNHQISDFTRNIYHFYDIRFLNIGTVIFFKSVSMAKKYESNTVDTNKNTGAGFVEAGTV